MAQVIFNDAQLIDQLLHAQLNLADYSSEFFQTPIDSKHPLEYALYSKDFSYIQSIVDKSNGASLVYSNHMNLCHLLAEHGLLDLLKYYVRLYPDLIKASIEKGLFKGWSCAHFAAANNHDHILDFLTQNNVSVEEYSNDGFTPLHIAIYFGKENAYHYLAKIVAHINQPLKVKNNFYFQGFYPLHLAAFSDHISLLSISQQEINQQIEGGYFASYTPLHLAAKRKATDSVEFLINAGADIRMKTNQGFDYQTLLGL